jgi:hypothetical protein
MVDKQQNRPERSSADVEEAIASAERDLTVFVAGLLPIMLIAAVMGFFAASAPPDTRLTAYGAMCLLVAGFLISPEVLPAAGFPERIARYAERTRWAARSREREAKRLADARAAGLRRAQERIKRAGSRKQLYRGFARTRLVELAIVIAVIVCLAAGLSLHALPGLLAPALLIATLIGLVLVLPAAAAIALSFSSDPRLIDLQVACPAEALTARRETVAALVRWRAQSASLLFIVGICLQFADAV